VKKRLLGVDFGHARIGLAISDPLHIIASPLETIQGSKNPERAAKNVAAELQRKKLDIGQIVVGLPLHLNGKESERSTEVRAFSIALERLVGIPVQLFDERLTSVQAERLMKNAQMTRKERASSVDGVSSTILLQSFLDLQGCKIS
jgi:putative Holliday junction resolvase